MTGTELVLASTTEAESVASFAASIDPSDHLLVVAFASSPDSVLDVVRDALDGEPAGLGIVGVGETTRSRSAGRISLARSSPPIATVAHPDDLPRLATLVDLFLREWDDADDLRVCFASFTEIVTRASPSSVTRFLHVVTNLVREAGASAAFYLHPRALDGYPAGAMRLMFDTVTHEDGTAGTAGTARADGDSSPNVPDSIAAVLDGAPRRRRALWRLCRRDGPVSTRALAEHLARADAPDDIDTEAAIEYLSRQLHHLDLPELAAAGLVITDENQSVVEATAAADRIRPFLSDDPA